MSDLKHVALLVLPCLSAPIQRVAVAVVPRIRKGSSARAVRGGRIRRPVPGQNARLFDNVRIPPKLWHRSTTERR